MLIGDQKTGNAEGVVISGTANTGLRVTVNGSPARLAVISEDGHIVADGEAVRQEVFAVSVNCYRDFLRGEGHLRTLSPPVAP